ncbi:MAG: cupin domain-containing protein [Candidatus Omnitrophica bacterium]|nr:cupin domain-containing protein [Candidatus Omnitrophota bacterium]
MEENNYLAKILDFAGLIEYQNGSVVSKIIIAKPAGTVTLFAFDAGQALSEHTAPFDALINIIDGAADIFISGELFSLKKGQSIILPAKQPHSLKAEEKFKMTLVMIKI